MSNYNNIKYTNVADQAISDLIDSAPTNLNTLNELAAALGDDENFATTVTNSLATKLTSSSSLNAANLTGTASAINGSNITNLAAAALSGALPAIDGSNLTGISSAPRVQAGGGGVSQAAGGYGGGTQSVSYSLSGFSSGGTIFAMVPMAGDNLTSWSAGISGASNVSYSMNRPRIFYNGTYHNGFGFVWGTFTGNASGNISVSASWDGSGFTNMDAGNIGWIAVGS